MKTTLEPVYQCETCNNRSLDKHQIEQCESKGNLFVGRKVMLKEYLTTCDIISHSSEFMNGHKPSEITVQLPWQISTTKIYPNTTWEFVSYTGTW
jgi:hypothetical protein